MHLQAPENAAASVLIGSSHDQRQARRVKHCAMRAASAGGARRVALAWTLRIPPSTPRRTLSIPCVLAFA